MNRTISVIAAASALVVAGSVGASAASLIQHSDLAPGAVHADTIKDSTISSRDIHDGGVHALDLRSALLAKIKAPGPVGPQGPQAAPGPQGPAGTPAKYAGPNWSVIDRNVIGNGDSALRAGPSSAGGVTPPLGVGSLGLRTGTGTDKAAFGNQSSDFAGKLLSGFTTVTYYAFVTGEDLSASAGNIPNIQFEINPANGAQTFSTLTYVAAGANANQWTKIDASAPATATAGWYFTNGALATSSGCTQASYCSLAAAQAAVPNATLFSVQFNKGRDFAFSGAVDALQLNAITYDFEPFGVTHN